MGYDVTTKKHSGNTVYTFTQASDGQFDSAKEVNGFLESKIANESGVLLDFDNDETARDIFSYMEDGCFKGEGFRLLNPEYWEQLPIDDFVYGGADRHTKPMKFLRDNYYELRNYFSKEKNIEALNAFIISGFNHVTGRITNISGNGNHIEAELKDREKFAKAEIFFQEEEPAGKRAFKIAEKTYLVQYVDLGDCTIPSSWGGYDFGMLGNGEVACDCYLEDCWWDEFFECEFDIYEVQEGEVERETFETAWRDKYKKKAMNMLRKQLIKDFGEDFWVHTEMYYGSPSCYHINLDNFYINYDEAFFTICFDKRWFAEWCSNNRESFANRPLKLEHPMSLQSALLTVEPE